MWPLLRRAVFVTGVCAALLAQTADSHAAECRTHAAQHLVRTAFKSWVEKSGSNCPSWFWLKKYNALYPRADKGEEAIVLDVGCNAGYSSGKLIRAYMPEWGFGPRDIYAYVSQLPLEGLPKDQTCGACNDCRENDAAALGTAPWPELIIHCFEPSKNHFLRLLASRAKFVPNHARRWHLHNVVVSSAPGLIRFPAEGCGELCAVHDAQGSSVLGHDQTLATSVDAFVAMLPRQSPPPRMVLLKIDTEGHDAAVLQGAADAIRHGVFDIITFEYGTTGSWANTNLSSVVARPGGLLSESAPYFCFYDGQGSAMPMSAGCFVDEMDV